MIFLGGKVHLIDIFFIQVTALSRIMNKQNQAATSTLCHNKAWFSAKPYLFDHKHQTTMKYCF